MDIIIFALIVLLCVIVLVWVADMLLGMIPNKPAHLQTLVRVIIVLVGLFVILRRALPALGGL
jgi:hypothetical protein